MLTRWRSCGIFQPPLGTRAGDKLSAARFVMYILEAAHSHSTISRVVTSPVCNTTSATNDEAMQFLKLFSKRLGATDTVQLECTRETHILLNGVFLAVAVPPAHNGPASSSSASSSSSTSIVNGRTGGPTFSSSRGNSAKRRYSSVHSNSDSAQIASTRVVPLGGNDASMHNMFEFMHNSFKLLYNSLERSIDTHNKRIKRLEEQICSTTAVQADSIHKFLEKSLIESGRNQVPLVASRIRVSVHSERVEVHYEMTIRGAEIDITKNIIAARLLCSIGDFCVITSDINIYKCKCIHADCEFEFKSTRKKRGNPFVGSACFDRGCRLQHT